MTTGLTCQRLEITVVSNKLKPAKDGVRLSMFEAEYECSGEYPGITEGNEGGKSLEHKI